MFDFALFPPLEGKRGRGGVIVSRNTPAPRHGGELSPLNPKRGELGMTFFFFSATLRLDELHISEF